MRNFFKSAGVVLLAVSLSACYHVQVETGLPANGQTITKPWASSFVVGLIPPATVQTAQQCPSGVAKVETKHSFLNGLVAGLTFSLYTPVTIIVSCAGSAARPDDASTIDAQALSGESLVAAFHQAAARASETGAPVTIQMR